MSNIWILIRAQLINFFPINQIRETGNKKQSSMAIASFGIVTLALFCFFYNMNCFFYFFLFHIVFKFIYVIMNYNWQYYYNKEVYETPFLPLYETNAHHFS